MYVISKSNNQWQPFDAVVTEYDTVQQGGSLMSAGIGGIGNLGGNIGGNPGVTQATAIPKDPLNAEALNGIHHKKHKEGDISFEAQINNLNKEKVAGIQSGTSGET